MNKSAQHHQDTHTRSTRSSIANKSSTRATLGALGVSLVVATTSVGCSSSGGLVQSAMLGAATGAVTRINGNSDDIKDAATVGALLGILGGLAR